MTDEVGSAEIAAELERMFSLQASDYRKLTRHITGPAHVEARLDMPADSAYVTKATMEWRDGKGYETRDLQFTAREDGPSITASGVRDMKIGNIEHMIRNDVLLNKATWSGGGWVELSHTVRDLVRVSKRLRPTKDVIDLVSIVAEYSLLRGGQPVKSIEGIFEVPNRTASRWLSLANRRDQFDAV